MNDPFALGIKLANRQKLLDAGWAEIQNHNWRPTTAVITAIAGLSTRAFFHHFPSMDAYLDQLVADHQHDFDALLSDRTKREFLNLILKGHL